MDIQLGKLITGEAQRDAIHIAIAPVVAGESLDPGENICLSVSGEAYKGGHPVGIVDPFLKSLVHGGERFYMFLYPNTVTSLRHEWTHPAFADALIADKREVIKSEAWLRDFAEDIGLSYGRTIAAANDYIDYGNDFCFDHDTPDRAYSDMNEFWRHFQNVTGRGLGGEREGHFFRCAC